MLSIACLSQKGGVGKSTLARLMATAYAHAGYKVKILDFNVKQTTSVDWAARRMAAGITPSVPAQPFSQLTQAVRDVGDANMVVFDGKPDADKTALEIAKYATMVLVPVGVTLDDLLPQARFAKELINGGVDKKRILFALNQVTDSALAISEARDFVTGQGYALAATDIPVRPAYQAAQNAGRAISETTFKTLNERAEALAADIVEALQALEARA